MSWKNDLDRYLTTEPDNGWQAWTEQVYESYTEEFCESMGDFEDSDLENNWLNKLFERDPEEAAAIIQRAYSLYVEWPRIKKIREDRNFKVGDHVRISEGYVQYNVNRRYNSAEWVPAPGAGETGVITRIDTLHATVEFDNPGFFMRSTGTPIRFLTKIP